MIFLYEPILYLLIIPLVFFILSFKTDKKNIEQFFSPEIIKKLRVSSSSILTNFSYRLFTLVSVLFIIALARPVFKENVVLKKHSQISLIVALDVSKSMNEKDIYPSRLDLAIQKLNLLVKQKKPMNIGIILFSDNAYSLFPISDDMKVLSYMIKQTDFHTGLGSGSNIFAALQAGESMLSRQKNKNILLLSDGGNSPNMSEELSYLKQKKIQLYAINIANKTHNGLKTLTKKSGGTYTDVSWGENDIKKLLNDIEKNSKIKHSKEYKTTRYTQLFIYPLSLAILILFFLFNSNIHLFSRKKVMILIISIAFSISSTPLQAGFLDFYYLYKANTLYKNKDYKEAIQEYKKLLETKNTINFKLFHNIANAYVKLDKLSLAKKYYEKSLEINPNSLSKKNLQEIIKELKERKKLKLNKRPRGISRITLTSDHLADLSYEKNSRYEVMMDKLVLSEEEMWLRRLQHNNTPSFLQKIKTDKRSKNASEAW